ncbi:MAG: MFS transporter [Alphaproteobacteria bacterium]|nr:MFS transporter [Alphaproteobacteria bacterium]
MQKPAPAGESKSWLDRTREKFAPENPDGTTSEPGRRRAMALLFTSLIANGLGQTLMFAILPPLANDLGLTEFGMGAIFAISAFLWVFSSAYWGARSDVWGRRPVILIGIAAFAISTFAFASVLQFGLWGLIPPAMLFPLMVATRSIYGLFGAGAYPAAQGYIADRTSSSERTEGIAMLNAAFGLGAAIGPGVGAALTIFGVVAPLYFVAFMALVSTVAVWLLLPERSAPHQRKIEKPLSWFDPRVLPFVVFAVMQGTAGSIPTQTVAFMIRDMQKLSISETQQLAGVALMGMAIAALFAQFVLVQRFKLTTRFLIIAGIIVALISNLLVVVASNYGLLAFALVLSGLGFGMLRPGVAAAASLSVSSEEQGAMAGLTGGAGAAGFIFAPLVGNGLYSWSPIAPYWFGAILMVLLLVFVITNSRIKSAVIQTFDGTSSDIQPP